MITLFSIIIPHSHRCFQNHVYMLLTSFSNMFLISPQLRIFQKIFITTTMDTAEYWPMACEYGIWNTAIASLQFWAEDLNLITLGIASECVYTTFFWTPTSHTLRQLPEDVLFGCFIIALNAAFTQQLSLADEGYESGSNTDLPTPLQKHHAYTTFPAWNMHSLIQPTLCHAAQLTCHTRHTTNLPQTSVPPPYIYF